MAKATWGSFTGGGETPVIHRTRREAKQAVWLAAQLDPAFPGVWERDRGLRGGLVYVSVSKDRKLRGARSSGGWPRAGRTATTEQPSSRQWSGRLWGAQQQRVKGRRLYRLSDPTNGT